MKAEAGHKDKPDYLASLKLLSRHMKDGRAHFLGALLAATASAILELVPFWSIYRLASAIVAGDAEWTLFLRLSQIFVFNPIWPGSAAAV